MDVHLGRMCQCVSRGCTGCGVGTRLCCKAVSWLYVGAGVWVDAVCAAAVPWGICVDMGDLDVVTVHNVDSPHGAVLDSDVSNEDGAGGDHFDELGRARGDCSSLLTTVAVPPVPSETFNDCALLATNDDVGGIVCANEGAVLCLVVVNEWQRHHLRVVVGVGACHERALCGQVQRHVGGEIKGTSAVGSIGHEHHRSEWRLGVAVRDGSCKRSCGQRRVVTHSAVLLHIAHYSSSIGWVHAVVRCDCCWMICIPCSCSRYYGCDSGGAAQEEQQQRLQQQRGCHDDDETVLCVVLCDLLIGV